MPRTIKEMGSVDSLGKGATEYITDYNPDLLECFINKHPDNDYWVSFDAFEFTSLCPKTGQPDYATIYINYVPDERMVESKSLKLYLVSFRNHGDFHEDVINIIADDLFSLLRPKYLEVYGRFNSRGGIAIYPFVQLCNGKKKYENLKQERFSNHATKIN